ncbi:MAG: ABC transporter ATP-binding protein, partial [Clostridia bacterium]|nr:ABC transporter ATP-binding protein [Clostridia bacterium]
MSEKKVLLEANHIKKYFQGRGKNMVKAVDDVSLTIHQGETLGLVGESGCGKSTLGRTLLRLIEPTEGEIRYNGQDLRKLSSKEMRQMRQHMQMVFQNPYSSLNPRMSVLESVRAPLDIFKIGTAEERFERCKEMLKYVGFEEYQIYRYPHEFSGGQRQRIVIARALISQPDFIVCDEPVSALDVSVRAQVLNLMRDINRERGVAYLFISHDLSVVKHV